MNLVASVISSISLNTMHNILTPAILVSHTKSSAHVSNEAVQQEVAVMSHFSRLSWVGVGLLKHPEMGRPEIHANSSEAENWSLN